MNPWIRRLFSAADLMVLGTIATGSIIVAVLDYFDALPKDGPFAAIQYSVLSVLLLSAVGLHIVYAELERRRDPIPELIRGQTDRTIRSLRGVAITVFETSEEMERYLARRILDARNEICDLSWKSVVSHGSALTPRKKSQAQYESSIDRVSNRIRYREVFVFSDERRIAKLERRLAKLKPGYSCRYYPEPIHVPRLQFVLIDNDEIVFASSSYPKLCAIRHPELCEMFKSYYEEVWSSATRLIEAGSAVQAEIAKVRALRTGTSEVLTSSPQRRTLPLNDISNDSPSADEPRVEG